MSKHGFSLHHQVPRSRNGSNDEANLVRLVGKYHVHFHAVFENRMPHEQIERILWINSTSLREEFKRKVRKALEAEEWYIYNDRILIPKR